MIGISERSLPAGWQIKRLDFVARVKARLGWKGLTASEYVDDGYVFLSTPNIKGSEIDFENVNYITSERYFESPEIMLRPGDVLLAKDGSTLGTCSVVRSLPRPSTVNGSIAVIRPNDEIDPVFLQYLFTSPEMQARILQFKDGMGVPHLFQSDLRKFPVVVPPIDKQRAIAKFLDREITRLDQVVAEQSRLLDLSDEVRRSTVTQSCFESTWQPSQKNILGELPPMWRKLRIATVATKICNGYVGPTRDLFVQGGVTYLQSLHIKENSIRFDPPYFVPSDWHLQHARSILATGDVLVVQTGDIGQVAVVPPEFCGANCHALIVIRCRKDVMLGSYLAWVLNSTYGFHALKAIQTGALHPHLNCTFVREIVVPVPPIDVQRRICSDIETRLAKVADLKRRAVEGRNSLLEYRSALISAAVTGQIDVRNYFPQEAAAACP